MTTLATKYAPPPNALIIESADLNTFLLAPVAGTELATTAAHVGVYDLVLYDLCVYA